MARFDGKVILISGGARGQGAAVAFLIQQRRLPGFLIQALDGAEFVVGVGGDAHPEPQRLRPVAGR